MKKMEQTENYKKAAELIKNADAVFITAGAGMGVDSGLPDFRGNKGFWNEYPIIAQKGISFSDMANPGWFEKDPSLAWAFYGHRLQLYRDTVPHKGFTQLLDIVKNKALGYFVFTSNVDGQFQKAGFEHNKIEEVHGSIHHLQCTEPCCTDIWSADTYNIEIDDELFEAYGDLPYCKKCNAVVRPNILMFGDWHWLPERSENQNIKLATWFGDLERKKAKLAVIEIGAGTAIPTVRRKSERIAAAFGTELIRINPRDAHIPRGYGIRIATGAAEGINGICEFL